MKVFSPLHAVPLIRRMRLGHEVRDAGRHLRVLAAHFLADLGDGLRHFNDAIQIDLPFAGQPAHEIQLHFVDAIFERLAATIVQILIADLLTDLLPHVVAGDFRRERHARVPLGTDERGHDF
jgi:hypothetical protein